MDFMEDNEKVRVSRRKESTPSPLAGSECQTPDSRTDLPGGIPGGGLVFEKTYPFALVLRLRVLQIVCGITAMVMGTVGVIEERQELNLGLALPAGGATVLAAAASIHTSRGFGGYRPSSCGPTAFLRFLGPSIRVATPLALLWGVACSLHAALLVQASRTIANTAFLSNNLLALATVEIFLSVVTVVAVIGVVRIDCLYDPD